MRNDSRDGRGRRSRRGGSRNSGNSGRRRENDRPATPQPKKPKSLLEKVIAFFTGGSGAPKPAPTARATGRTQEPKPASATRESRPAREQKEPSRSRKPELVEVTSPKLYVGNLSFDASESDLFDLFRGVGEVQNAEIVANKYTMKSKGFGFVTMTSVEQAARAVEVLHDKEFMGRKLLVSGAKTNDTQRENRGERREEEQAASAGF